MTDRLNSGPPSKPAKKTTQEWIERGNRILWGEEPTSKGEWLPPRRDLQWACVNGNYFIEPRK
jgi:hypothetical protein